MAADLPLLVGQGAGAATYSVPVQTLLFFTALTFLVMGPTIDKVYSDAYQPYSENRIAFDEALRRGEVPMRAFMLKQTRQADVMLFAKLAKIDASVKSADVPFKVLVPAFVTSELKSAFQIGFLIFIPF